MQPFLEQLGFPSDQQCQMVLLDAPGWPHYRRPTLANMRQAIRWLVHDVRTGHLDPHPSLQADVFESHGIVFAIGEGMELGHLESGVRG